MIANTAARVTSSDGNYKLGDSFNIVVNFTDARDNLVVSGTPTLTLETGQTDATVNMASVSGKAITFTYQVGAGHESSDLVYTATNALTAGTHIRDEAGNDANRTLPDIATFTEIMLLKLME
ncbi:hypothetical protein CM15mP37_10170 [bacterium]|nr:MAG: hypothetical protein CM15mP37_10170 [bacterium]